MRPAGGGERADDCGSVLAGGWFSPFGLPRAAAVLLARQRGACLAWWLIALGALLPVAVTAAPGVDERTMLSEVTVTVDGRPTRYALFQSALNPRQWYAAALEPRLVLRQVGPQTEPEMTLLRYQHRDPKDRQQMVQGAYLSFSLALGPSDDALGKLEAKIPRPATGGRVLLSALPVEALELSLVGPRGGKVLAVASAARGLASRHVAREVTFTVPFGPADTDLVETLITGPTGVRFSLVYNYAVLDEPKPLPVKVDWDQIRRRRLTGSQRDREELKKYVRVEGRGDLELNADTLAFLQRRAANLARSGGGASRSAGSLRGGSGRTGAEDRHRPDDSSSRARRDLNLLVLERRLRSGRTLAAEGFIGLGAFPEEVRQRRVIIEDDPVGWRYAYLHLPRIGQPEGLPIDSVEFEVALRHGTAEYGRQTFTWQPMTGWRDRYGAPSIYGRFSLDRVLADHPRGLADCRFLIRQSIRSHRDDLLTTVEELPVAAGDTPVVTPMELVEVVGFDFSFLPWRLAPPAAPAPSLPPPAIASGGAAVDGTVPAPVVPPAQLIRIEVQLESGSRRIKRVLQPENRGGAWQAPEAFRWLVERETPMRRAAPVKANLHFFFDDGSRAAWACNGRNLRESFAELSVIFFPETLVTQ